MDSFGILGLLPPILIIVLAFITKDVIFSLFVGIFAGTLIVANGDPFSALLALTDRIANALSDGWNIRIVLFCALLGAFVGMLSKTGAAYAFGKWASSNVKSRKGALLVTWIFGLIIFIDDYFNSLTIGTVMRPVTDEKKISRAKLSYILDSTAAPVCIIAPISSWVVTVMSVIRGSEGFVNLKISEFAFFIKLIPVNFYALLTILMVLAIIIYNKDFGPMRDSEMLAINKNILFNEDKYGPVTGKIETKDENNNVKPFDMIIPLLILIISCVVFFPMVTYINSINGENIKNLSESFRKISIGDAFKDTDASAALFYAIIFTIVLSYIYFIVRKLLNLRKAGEAIIEGIKSMIPALVILALAWTISGLIKTPKSEGGLGLPVYLSNIFVEGNFPISILPILVFIISCLISFSTGTSWGTFTIMIPISLPIVISLSQSLGYSYSNMLNISLITVGGILAGAIFGDHCSPISDTTILSSTGASCPHLEHVTTQIPYALFVAFISGIGYIIAGIIKNVFVSGLISFILFLVGYILISSFFDKKYDNI
ncbi:MAG: Na+/H+ antiporter NhaC family protein [Spirochaetes bacterium]|nr:Na+/H+ antiporter NhaC family protein [Spirochaetota bacterium]